MISDSRPSGVDCTITAGQLVSLAVRGGANPVYSNGRPEPHLLFRSIPDPQITPLLQPMHRRRDPFAESDGWYHGLASQVIA
jgi:hypothetical protein